MGWWFTCRLVGPFMDKEVGMWVGGYMYVGPFMDNVVDMWVGGYM